MSSSRYNPTRFGVVRPGDRFGLLTAIELGPYLYRTKQRTWKCRCDCGREIVVRQDCLRSGNTASCGCQRKEHAAEAARRRCTTHGQSKIAEYFVWKTMKARCLNPRNSEFKNYGGRGIWVCDRWRTSFVAFIQDLGLRPSPAHSIDRINNDGNYEPENCRWAIGKEQARNTRANHRITIDGVIMTIAGWAERSGLKSGTISRRLLVYGWSAKEAVGKSARKIS